MTDVTKVIVTHSCALRLAEQGQWPHGLHITPFRLIPCRRQGVISQMASGCHFGLIQFIPIAIYDVPSPRDFVMQGSAYLENVGSGWKGHSSFVNAEAILTLYALMGFHRMGMCTVMT